MESIIVAFDDDVGCNVPRTATHVARRTNNTHARGKSVEQLSIERLVLQLIEDASDVFVRYLVVAGFVVVAFVCVHMWWRVMSPTTRRAGRTNCNRDAHAVTLQRVRPRVSKHGTGVQG